jgi:hypothetical protein
MAQGLGRRDLNRSLSGETGVLMDTWKSGFLPTENVPNTYRLVLYSVSALRLMLPPPRW